MKRSEDSRTLGFAGFLRRAGGARATTSPRRRPVRFFAATVVAGTAGAAIAVAAAPHKAPAATGTTQTAVAVRVSKEVVQGRRTTMSATVSTPAAAPGPPPRTGTVPFWDGGKPIATCRAQTLTKLTATCEVTFWDT